MKKLFSLSLILLLLFAFPGITYAAENPFPGLTKEQITKKYFEGRQLDPIEGVWDCIGLVFIIKASLVDNLKEYKDYDYIMVEYGPYKEIPQNVDIFGIHKTDLPHAYAYGKWNRILKQISPTTLIWEEHDWRDFWRHYITRIYPN